MLVQRVVNVLREEGLRTLFIRSIDYTQRIILLEYIPMRVYAIIAPIFWKRHSNRPNGPIRYDPKNNIWVVKQSSGENFYSPNPKIRHGQEPHAEARLDDYTLDSFVAVEEGDTVVDVGSFVGGFSIGVAPMAKNVIAIEPDPRNATCTRKNTSQFQNVSVIEEAVWKENDMVDFNVSTDPTDNSLLSPDWGGKSSVVSVKANRFDNIMRDAGILDVDFLKMDAEGVEPEALFGIRKTKPKKIAVDCGAERDGDDTCEEVLDLLQSKDYSTKYQGDMVYAKLSP